MDSRRTAVAGAVRRVAEYALRQGIEEDALRRDLGVPLASLDVPEQRVGIERLFGLWASLARRLHDVALPIRVAEHAQIEDLHVLGFAIMSAPTLGHGLRTLVRYCPLLTTSGVWDLRTNLRVVDVRWRRGAPSSLGGRLSNETAVAQVVGGLRRLGGAGLDPLRVSFRHPAPSTVSAHRAYFRCPVLFDASEDAIELPRDVLESVPRGANAGLWEYLCRDAEARARTLAPRPTIDVVLDEVTRHLARGDRGAPSLDAVASALGSSDRTLRRRLRSEGTSFRALVDRARRERAVELLRGGISVGQAAFEAGFSDASALTHAARRWFGCAPRQLRAKLLDGAASGPRPRSAAPKLCDG